jgi:uncharacterized protein (DUF1330 family)
MGAQEGQILPHLQQEESDMAAYIIGLRRSEPRGTAWLEEYLPKTAALIAKHGGKVVIGGNAPQALMASPFNMVIFAQGAWRSRRACRSDTRCAQVASSWDHEDVSDTSTGAPMTPTHATRWRIPC